MNHCLPPHLVLHHCCPPGGGGSTWHAREGQPRDRTAHGVPHHRLRYCSTDPSTFEGRGAVRCDRVRSKAQAESACVEQSPCLRYPLEVRSRDAQAAEQLRPPTACTVNETGRRHMTKMVMSAVIEGATGHLGGCHDVGCALGLRQQRQFSEEISSPVVLHHQLSCTSPQRASGPASETATGKASGNMQSGFGKATLFVGLGALVFCKSHPGGGRRWDGKDGPAIGTTA